ncbi:MAG: hypothetical protein HYZ42_17250 [Bacteroidetes bacterium]|nr:hypothetical protein [Bacteroidota bacterium]
MKTYIHIVLFVISFVLVNSRISAQTDSSREVLGISGSSIYNKYSIQIIGNKKDTISVFDSAAVKMPLQSDYYFLRVYRINMKGELKEFKVKSFFMVVQFENDSGYTQEFTNKYMEDPLLSHFKKGKAGNLLSIGSIQVMDENDKLRNAGTYQMLYR